MKKLLSSRFTPQKPFGSFRMLLSVALISSSSLTVAYAQRDPKPTVDPAQPPPQAPASPALHKAEGKVMIMTIGPDGVTHTKTFESDGSNVNQLIGNAMQALTVDGGTLGVPGQLPSQDTMKLFKSMASKPFSDSLREKLTGLGVSSTAETNALVDFVEAQQKKHAHLHELQAKLSQSLWTGGLDPETGKCVLPTAADIAKGDAGIDATYPEVMAEAEADHKQYPQDLAELDGKIHYSQKPRLASLLQVLGLLNEDPVFSLGFGFSDFVGMDPVSKLNLRDMFGSGSLFDNFGLLPTTQEEAAATTAPATTAPATTAPAGSTLTGRIDKTALISLMKQLRSPALYQDMKLGKMSPDWIEQLKACGIQDEGIQDTLVYFLTEQQKQFTHLRELNADLVTSLQNWSNTGLDDDAFKTKFTAFDAEFTRTQQQYDDALAELKKNLPPAQNHRVYAALESLNLLKNTPMFSLGVQFSPKPSPV